MSIHAEISRCREVHALYHKLWSLGLDVRAERCAAEVLGRRVVVEGLKSLNPDHADRLMRMVRANEAGLLEIIPDERTSSPAASRRQGSGA